jgi:hypothetical protein
MLDFNAWHIIIFNHVQRVSIIIIIIIIFLVIRWILDSVLHSQPATLVLVESTTSAPKGIYVYYIFVYDSRGTAVKMDPIQ